MRSESSCRGSGPQPTASFVAGESSGSWIATAEHVLRSAHCQTIKNPLIIRFKISPHSGQGINTVAGRISMRKVRGYQVERNDNHHSGDKTVEYALVKSGAVRTPRLSRRSRIITGGLRRRVRNIRGRGEYGVQRGIARCGSSGLVLRYLLLKDCNISALARLGSGVPTLRLGLIGANAAPGGVQISDGHHGEAIAAVGGLPIRLHRLLVPIGRITPQLSGVVFKAENQPSLRVAPVGGFHRPIRCALPAHGSFLFGIGIG